MWPHIDVVVGDISKIAQIPNSQFDVIIVPLLAFDERRSRLGLGGGWYDRFLSTQQHAVTIGLAHEVQKVSQVAVEPHDVALTHIVTEQSIY
jgi:5-formyltetrahydrofolate cyclo-ligase